MVWAAGARAGWAAGRLIRMGPPRARDIVLLVRMIISDAWGDSLQTFCLQFGMYTNGKVNSKSKIFCIDNSIKKFFIVKI